MDIPPNIGQARFNVSETSTTRDVTTLRALNLAMGVLALMSWGGFAYGVDALRDSSAVVERASGEATAIAGSTLYRAGWRQGEREGRRVGAEIGKAGYGDCAARLNRPCCCA